MLLKALPDIKKKYQNILYAIIGDGQEREYLISLIKKYSLQHHVQILSNVSDEEMIRCYQQCTVFILPNRTVGKDIEGFGGKAVLAGDSGGTAETMIIGKTGYVIDCTAPLPLANKVIEMLSNSEKLHKMGEHARLHAINHLDWNIHVKNALLIFQLLEN